jgi:hypothetical protein
MPKIGRGLGVRHGLGVGRGLRVRHGLGVGRGLGFRHGLGVGCGSGLGRISHSCSSLVCIVVVPGSLG